jgi:hypothetical protein
VSVQTPQQHWYWISFIDDFTHYRVVYLLQKKSDAFTAFKEFKAFAEKQMGFTLKALRDDKGGEYMGKEMDQFLRAHGILREHTTTATPQQNGVAECTNRILDEGITSMLHEASLPGSFWGDALGAFVHVLNRSPSSALDGITPYEAWFNGKPSVSHSVFLDAKLTFMCRRTSVKALNRRVIMEFSLGIHQTSRAGRCMIHLLRKRSFQEMWSSMNNPCLAQNLVTLMVCTSLYTWPQCQRQGEINSPTVT